jgi:hypothetical protein
VAVLLLSQFRSGLVGGFDQNYLAGKGENRLNFILKLDLKTTPLRVCGHVLHAVRFSFRHFAQRAFCAATIRLRAAVDIFRLLAEIETTFRPLILAHLAR